MAGLLGGTPAPAGTLRARLDAGGMLLAPGCYDALGARLIEEAGFRGGVHDRLRHRCGPARPARRRPADDVRDGRQRASDRGGGRVPVIADADTGYGNPISVIRTVQEYEAAGVAAIHIEDQVMPKRCGHMEDKQVIPAPTRWRPRSPPRWRRAAPRSS